MDYLKFMLSLALWIILVESQSQKKDLNYEIKSLSAEPDYRSVNLSWETENKVSENQIENSEDSEDLTRSFAVYYCELQSWGEMHRCKSKIVEDEEDEDLETNSLRSHNLMVKNLRMATKYSFHVKPLNKNSELKIQGRSEDFAKDEDNGQTIVVPTKGFSAIATKCLPDSSEIEVETGPFFGGKIASEKGDCGIDGNSKDPREIYTMRIDHKKCGSSVSHDDLTVETYITVQENSGLLTHSTRRFLVVCTFQPDTLTVRARLALPGKGGAAALDEDLWPERERGARERQFKMVDRTALVLKDSEERSMENAIGDIENLTEKIMAFDKMSQVVLEETKSDQIKKKKVEYLKEARYSRLSTDYERQSSLHEVHSIIGITLGVALSALLVFAVIYLLQQGSRKQNKNMEKLHSTAVYT